MATNNHHNRATVLIVDDHEVVRNGIRSYLETVSLIVPVAATSPRRRR